MSCSHCLVSEITLTLKPPVVAIVTSDLWPLVSRVTCPCSTWKLSLTSVWTRPSWVTQLSANHRRPCACCQPIRRFKVMTWTTVCVCPASPGDDVLSAYSSPLLVDLLDAAIRQVEHPRHVGQTVYSQAERDGGSWRMWDSCTAGGTQANSPPHLQSLC